MEVERKFFYVKISLMERRDFYTKALKIAIPIIVQNGITNLVAMLDNVMIGQVGTNQMSGVAIVNQLMFVFNLCIFGGLAGIGIFTSQFSGKGDHEGIRYTFRLMLGMAVILCCTGYLIFFCFSDSLINLYLNDSGNAAGVAETLASARQYLNIMYWSLAAFALTQVYSSTLRSCGDSRAPMRASLAAVLTNLIGNWLLIAGNLGFPRLGIAGAAIATVISRFVELILIVLYTHRNADTHPFIRNVYRSLYVPKALAGQCFIKGFPLLMNEALWSIGETTLVQNYSMRGLSVIAAMNISNTICNLFAMIFISLGSAIGIVIGQELGAGRMEHIKKDANNLALFAIAISIVVGVITTLLSNKFPQFYNTSDEIRSLAAAMIRINALCMPLNSYANSAYFTIRSGGKTWITFLFDSCFTWIVSIPIAFVLVRYTALDINVIYACVLGANVIKCIIGFILIQRGRWIVNMTADRA